MPLTVRTHEAHPDPDLRTRFFHADAASVYEALAAALEEHRRWELQRTDPQEAGGEIATAARRLLPPVQDHVVVTVEPHGSLATQVTASLERSGWGKLRFMARDALKEVLHLVDMRFQQAKDSPLRTQGYAQSGMLEDR